LKIWTTELTVNNTLY